MKHRTIATISRHGSVIWTTDPETIDPDTTVRILLFAEDIAHYQSTKGE